MELESEGSGVILDEGMVSDLCQVFSNFIRHYRRKLYYFVKWRFQKVLNKRVPLIVSNVYREKHLFHNDISPHFKFLFSNERLDFLFFK